jgi:hypothetical protein
VNPVFVAILAGIVRQLLIAASGIAVFRGIKTDDSTVEWVTGVAVALLTAAYSAWKKQKLHTEVKEAKAETKAVVAELVDTPNAAGTP